MKGKAAAKKASKLPIKLAGHTQKRAEDKPPAKGDNSFAGQIASLLGQARRVSTHTPRRVATAFSPSDVPAQPGGVQPRGKQRFVLPGKNAKGHQPTALSGLARRVSKGKAKPGNPLDIQPSKRQLGQLTGPVLQTGKTNKTRIKLLQKSRRSAAQGSLVPLRVSPSGTRKVKPEALPGRTSLDKTATPSARNRLAVAQTFANRRPLREASTLAEGKVSEQPAGRSKEQFAYVDKNKPEVAGYVQPKERKLRAIIPGKLENRQLPPEGGRALKRTILLPGKQADLPGLSSRTTSRKSEQGTKVFAGLKQIGWTRAEELLRPQVNQQQALNTHNKAAAQASPHQPGNATRQATPPPFSRLLVASPPSGQRVEVKLAPGRQPATHSTRNSGKPAKSGHNIKSPVKSNKEDRLPAASQQEASATRQRGQGLPLQATSRAKTVQVQKPAVSGLMLLEQQGLRAPGRDRVQTVPESAPTVSTAAPQARIAVPAPHLAVEGTTNTDSAQTKSGSGKSSQHTEQAIPLLVGNPRTENVGPVKPGPVQASLVRDRQQLFDAVEQAAVTLWSKTPPAKLNFQVQCGLGQVKVSLTRQVAGLHLQLSVDNQQAREALQQTLSQLGNRLQQLGCTLIGAEVSAQGNRQFFSSHSFESPAHRRHQQRKPVEDAITQAPISTVHYAGPVSRFSAVA